MTKKIDGIRAPFDAGEIYTPEDRHASMLGFAFIGLWAIGLAFIVLTVLLHK